MNDGRATYLGHQGAPSTLALAFVPPDVECYVFLYVDTRSDQLSIFLHLPQLCVVPRKVHHATNWDHSRHLFSQSWCIAEPLGAIPQSLKTATIVLSLPVSYPPPHLKFFAHRAPFRRL